MDAVTNDAVATVVATGAQEALTAHEEVPNNEPVILALLPDTLIASALNVPSLTESLEETCSIGNPDISFTENREPESESVTENNCP